MPNKPKKSYSEHLLEQHPELHALFPYYESLGMSEPVLRALSESRGEPAVALAALVHGLCSEVAAAGDSRWLEQLHEGELNINDGPLLSDAQQALGRLRELGVAGELLMPLVRAAQAQAVNNIAAMIDMGPEIVCLPLPPGREAHWQLFDVDVEDGETPGKGLSGFALDVRHMLVR
ncbi:MAG: hypothetical protein LBV56_14490 [Delftia acidovorans]|jgi:hypothetical protein|nr:hypothetical protein [Delftia acidovorans]